MHKKPFCLFLILLLIVAVRPAQAQTRLAAASVGKADALLVQTQDAVVLIDTGTNLTFGKIVLAMETLGVQSLDAVVITHTDEDHVGGLTQLLQSGIPVRQWAASAYLFDKKSEKHPLAKAAAEYGFEVQWLKAGDALTVGSTAFEVLAPLEPATDKDNNNSLVLRLANADGVLLLCGDMEYPEEEDLLASGTDLACTVLKVANHGDDDTCSAAFLERARPEIAVISTSTEEKVSTPDPALLVRLQSIGAETCVTDATDGGILVTMDAGAASARFYSAPTPQAALSLKVRTQDDAFEITNRAEVQADLSGVTLTGTRGKDSFVFPDGTVLAAGQTLVVGTNSTKGGADVLWDIKKAVSKKKKEVFILADRYGTTLATADNGL